MNHRNLLIICLFAVFLVSCGKIELPEAPTDTDEIYGGTDSVDNKDAEDGSEDDDNSDGGESGLLTVKDVLLMTGEDYVNLSAYIVGYVDGTSISKSSVFGVPTDQPNTNLLLADSPNETNPDFCLPVKLEKDGASPTRDELNLYDHPQLLKQKITLYGFVSTYFKRNGIISIFEYRLSANDKEEQSPTSPDEGNSETDEAPTMNDSTEQVIDGR